MRAVSKNRLKRNVARWSEEFIESRPALPDLTGLEKPVRSYHGFEVWDGKAVTVAVAVDVPVGGGRDVAVDVPVAVPVGAVVEVGICVAVCVAVDVRVSVGKTMETGVSVAVAVARGVRVTTFGTQMDCPVDRPYCPAGMQLANWSWDMVTL